MQKKKPGPHPKLGKDRIHYRIILECKDMRKINEAASRRGFGTQEFIRLVCNLAAEKVLSQPAEEVLGLTGDSVTPGRTAPIAG